MDILRTFYVTTAKELITEFKINDDKGDKNQIVLCCYTCGIRVKSGTMNYSDS